MGRDESTTATLDAGGAADSATLAFHASALETPALGRDVAATIAWAVEAAERMPRPGGGATATRWEMLAAAAQVDVAAARVLEPHADALAILAEAQDAGCDVDGIGGPDASWGVFAAEGPGAGLTATPGADGRWRLAGTKPWCSLASSVSHALVTAWVDGVDRRLFAVDLTQPEVRPRPGPWVGRALPEIVSASVDFDEAAAAPIGDPGWYLGRPGFAWGGIGVSAVWWGSVLPFAARLAERAERADADQVSQVLAGEARMLAWSMRATLAEAAGLVDAAGSGAGPGGAGGEGLAAITRAIVHEGAQRIRDLAVGGLGPGPLAVDEDYARRAADLELYLRQHHGPRDLARLGRTS